MIKKLYLPLLMALVVALSSCSNKMGALSSDYFTTTPQVLEAVGGKVPVTINGKFPEKYFKKNAVVEVTPVLKWEGGQVKGQPAVFQGEKVEGNDQTISYKMGGNYTMKTTFDYVPEMAKSELYLEFNAKVGKKTIAIPAVKIADGVISTSELINNTLSSANPALGDDAFQRIIKEAHNANIMFLIQQANIRSSELKTAKEFNKEVANVNDAENKKISNIEISAYASPDGGVKLNTGLAENREGNTTKLINKDLKKAKIEVPVDAKYTAQDWEGFQELVSKSNIQDKELILRVLSMYQDRFKDASDFTFIFVGNVDVEKMKPVIAEYLGALPAINRQETFKDNKIEVRQGVYKNEFTKKQETPKASVFVFYSGDCKYDLRNNLLLGMTSQILDLVYTEKVREDEGGTYGVYVGGRLQKYPKEKIFLQIIFDTAPDKKEKLMKIIFDEITDIAKTGPSETNLNKVKEYMLKKHTEDLKENSYWLGSIDEYLYTGVNRVNDYEKIVNSITVNDIRKFADDLFKQKNEVEVTMVSAENK